MLKIYPTSRAIRDITLQNLTQNQILDKMMSIDEFFQRVIVIKNKILIDSEMRVLMLSQASEKLDIEKKFGFERDFIKFLRNSEFFFKFFDELVSEMVDIDSIKSSDLYSEFEEHIDILNKLLINYKNLLNTNGYYDRLTQDEYILNSNFLADIEQIEFYADGILTNFELKLLFEIAEVVDLKFILHIDKFNKRIVKKLESFGFLDLKVDKQDFIKYILDFKTKKVLSSENIKITDSILVENFSERVMQVNFIFKEIHRYIKEKNISPERIAIVLPDESFAKTLRLFDSKRNFNFAMGEDFKETLFFRYLRAILNYLLDSSLKQNREELIRLDLKELILDNKKLYNIDYKGFLELIEKLKYKIKDSKIKELVDDSIFKLNRLSENIKDENITNLLSLFINRVSDLSIDDTRGGKIKVIGFLESRYINFDAVIIIDFNEEFVPKPSSKDIFLNSYIKEKSNLPTRLDRENLQKYYYKRIFANSKNVSISYVNSNTTLPSRFFDELNISKETTNSDYEIFNITSVKHFVSDSPILELNDFRENFIFSHSSFKDFYECKYRFYIKYIQKIKEHNFSIKPKVYEVGNVIHNALKNVLNSKFSDFANLEKSIFSAIDRELKDNNCAFLRTDIAILKSKLNQFIENEQKRYNDGYKILYVEKEFEDINFCGFKFRGRIDRIDTKDKKLHILDYKSQKDVKIQSDDFQLFIYSLVFENIASLSLYSLFEGKLIYEESLNEKRNLLKEFFNELNSSSKIKFEKNLNKCYFCPYKIICDV